MRILWGALRAVSVETMGVLVVLWMLQGAAGLSLEVPWRATALQPSAGVPDEPSNTLMARGEPVATVALNAATQRETRRAAARQWFNTLFNPGGNSATESAEIERRAEYARERLDHFSRLYGIAVRD